MAYTVDTTPNPAGWTGHKYLYDGGWTLNPDWVDPELPIE